MMRKGKGTIKRNCSHCSMSGHSREMTLGGRNYKQADKLLVTSVEPATCQVWWGLLLGDPSILQVPARSDNVQKLSFLLFQKELLGKKKKKKILKRLYLHLICNESTQCLGCWLQPVKLWGFQGTTANWHSLSLTLIYQRYVALAPLLLSSN